MSECAHDYRPHRNGVRCRVCGDTQLGVSLFILPPSVCRVVKEKYGPIVGSSYVVPTEKMKESSNDQR